MVTPEATVEAFNRIYDEAEALLRDYEMPEQVREGLRRIQAVARYRFDPLPGSVPKPAEDES